MRLHCVESFSFLLLLKWLPTQWKVRACLLQVQLHRNVLLITQLLPVHLAHISHFLCVVTWLVQAACFVRVRPFCNRYLRFDLLNS